MKKLHLQGLIVGFFSLFSLFILNCSGHDDGVGLPTSVKTGKADSFELNKIFIDSRTASAAFLILRKYENGSVGEIVQGNKLPLGYIHPITVPLGKAYQLSPGKQKLKITVYIDENKDGQYNDSDSVFMGVGGPFDKVVEIELSGGQFNIDVELLSSVKTDRAYEFKVGKILIPKTTAKASFLLLFEDKNGKPGELLETQKIKEGGERVVSMKLTPPFKLLSGKQTLHLAVHLDKNGNGTYEKTDPVAQMNGTPIQQPIEVELTTTRYENKGTFVSKVHTLKPKEFVVGKTVLATDGKVRYYIVTRLIEDGKPGKTLGVNEWRFEGREHEIKVKLEHQVRKFNQKIHVGIYTNTTSKGWDEETWDKNAALATTREGKKFEKIIDVTFESSVSDIDSPYYAYTCGDLNAKYVKYKTKLLVDCRCPLNRVKKPTYNLCSIHALEASGYTLGKGPRLNITKGHQTSGDVWEDRNEIIFGIDRGGVSDPNGGLRRRFTIAALNYKTNTRRFVSGEAKDPAQGEFVVGKGPLGQEISYIRKGPDNQAYLYSTGKGGWIMKVNLDSGDREVIWKHNEKGYGQCPNGVKPEGDPDWKLGDSKPAPYQNAIAYVGFTIGPDGSFYISTTANGSPRPGYAIIRISKDGKNCKIISTSGAKKRNAHFGGIGKGYNIEGPVGAMTWHDGKIMAITWAGDLLEVNPTTGDRRRVAGSRITGSGSLPVSYRIFVDPKTKLLMLTGFLPPNNPGLLGVDLTTGKLWSFLCLNVDKDNPYTTGCMRGPQSTLDIAHWPGYRLPDGSYIGGLKLTGFSHYEISTGNSYSFSY